MEGGSSLRHPALTAPPPGPSGLCWAVPPGETASAAPCLAKSPLHTVPMGDTHRIREGQSDRHQLCPPLHLEPLAASLGDSPVPPAGSTAQTSPTDLLLPPMGQINSFPHAPSPSPFSGLAGLTVSARVQPGCRTTCEGLQHLDGRTHTRGLRSASASAALGLRPWICTLNRFLVMHLGPQPHLESHLAPEVSLNPVPWGTRAAGCVRLFPALHCVVRLAA